MKKILLIALLLGSIAGAYSQQKGGRYALKSGHVEYKLGGNATGTKTIWWDNYGEKTYTEEKSVTVTKFMGMTSREETHKITITVKDKFWSADLLEGSGQKGTLEYYDMGLEMAESMTEAEAKQLEEEIIASFGGERLGTESVLGNTCEVIEIMGVKSWICKGVTLKVEGKVLGIETKEIATDFDKNCSVPSSKFNPPSGIDYTDFDAQRQAYYGEMMDNSDDYEEEESDVDLVPLSYPYSKFLSGISPLVKKGYIKTMAKDADGQYMAVFMKGMMAGLTVVATSHKNLQNEGNDDFSHLEKFTHNGNTCYYGREDGEILLAVDFRAKDMLVLFAPSTNQSKEQLLKLADCCTF